MVFYVWKKGYAWKLQQRSRMGDFGQFGEVLGKKRRGFLQRPAYRMFKLEDGEKSGGFTFTPCGIKNIFCLLYDRNNLYGLQCGRMAADDTICRVQKVEMNVTFFFKDICQPGYMKGAAQLLAYAKQIGMKNMQKVKILVVEKILICCLFIFSEYRKPIRPKNFS